jgi:acetyltransferase
MLKDIFSPKSLAFIGASGTPGKLGYDILSNLKHLGYEGEIYPINPKRKNILGLKTYVDIYSLPEKPDLVLIAIPSPLVNDVVKECGQRGIQNIVIISAGFKEIGGEGLQREKYLQFLVQKYNLRLIGPNCLGIINTEKNMNASFAEGMPERGNVSLVSQSGAMAVAIIDWAYESGLGFSKIISMGNKAGITENELLEYLEHDSKTRVILMYLESITHGKEFMRIARRVSMKKPIIIIKSGVSEAGSEAISSHTGSLAGSDVVVDVAFLQSGIIRAKTIQELFDLAKIFSAQNILRGNRLGIVTNAGGPGIMATDSVENTSLQLGDLSSQIQEKLQKGLPKTASLHNPVDVIGDALANRYQHAAKTLLESDEIDALLIILTPQVMTEVKKTAEIITALSHQYQNKVVISAFVGGQSVRRGDVVFRRNRFPSFSFPSRAVSALGKMYEYVSWKNEEKKQSKKIVKKTVISQKTKLDTLFSRKKKGDRLSLREIDLLADSYGIPSLKVRVAKTVSEAIQYAKETGYPVVMKIVSPQIYHKTDAGGIRIDVETKEDVKDAWRGIMRNVKKYNPKAEISGISVETMVPVGKEILIGVKKDQQFGHTIVFGLGGIYVEVLKDVTFRVAPLDFRDAFKMIEEIKTIELLKGARGEDPVDLESIANVIVMVSRMVVDYPQIREFEINPLIACPCRGMFAVDINCVV